MRVFASVSHDLNTAAFRLPGAAGRRGWLVVALSLALLLVLTALLLPYVRRAWAFRNLRSAGFVLLTDKASLPEWARRLTADALDRPVSVMTDRVSVRDHLASFRHIGPLDDVSLVAEPGVTAVFPLQPKLRGISLVNGEITPEIMAALAGLPDLEVVGLEDCRIDAPTLGGLSRLPKLKHLSLAGTPLDAECVAALSELRSLDILALERTGAPESDVQKLQDALPHIQITDD